jgi:hypothetical protein
MTIILSCLTPEFTVQVSDRRLTTLDGKVHEDQSNKALFHCTHYAFAYTGLANLGGKNSIDWLSDVLARASDIGDGLKKIEKSANAALAALHFRPQLKRTAFVGVGFVSLRDDPEVDRRPVLTIISNFFSPPNKWSSAASAQFVVWHRWLEATEHASLFVAGQQLRPSEEAPLRRAIQRCVRSELGPMAITRLLARQVRQVAKRNAAVGANIMCTIVPRSFSTGDDISIQSAMIPLVPEVDSEAQRFQLPRGPIDRPMFLYLPGGPNAFPYYGPALVCGDVQLRGTQMNEALPDKVNAP